MKHPIRLQTFWKATRTCAWAKDLSGHSTLIPMKLFGDGVAVQGLGKSWGKSISCLTLAGILNEGGSKSTTTLAGNLVEEEADQ
eukprot:5347603-Amphidinium_carterae.4